MGCRNDLILSKFCYINILVNESQESEIKYFGVFEKLIFFYF